MVHHPADEEDVVADLDQRLTLVAAEVKVPAAKNLRAVVGSRPGQGSGGSLHATHPAMCYSPPLHTTPQC